ncbi:PEP-CTERM sorting domain-containing protein [bacterium]|nr:MAG: PEP-CTERM sorting domain-containing protein [bacterium]
METPSILRASLLAASLGAAVAASAQGSPAITSVTSTNVAGSVNGAGNQTIGWQFTIAQPISVSRLGYHDLTPDTELVTTHHVGIWDAGGTLMTSTTVLLDDPLTDGFRYHTLAAPIVLAPGTYNLGASIVDTPSDDPALADVYYFQATAITTDPLITFVGAAASDDGTGFVNPTSITIGSLGRFGPNMAIEAVPEPATIAAVGLGVLGLLKRRKKA